MLAKDFTNGVQKVLEICINIIILNFRNMEPKDLSLRAALQKP